MKKKGSLIVWIVGVVAFLANLATIAEAVSSVHESLIPERRLVPRDNPFPNTRLIPDDEIEITHQGGAK